MWNDTDYGRNDWNDYNDTAVMQKIEDAYLIFLNNRRKSVFKFRMQNKPYNINFTNMKQTNEISKYSRSIERREFK